MSESANPTPSELQGPSPGQSSEPTSTLTPSPEPDVSTAADPTPNQNSSGGLFSWLSRLLFGWMNSSGIPDAGSSEETDAEN